MKVQTFGIVMLAMMTSAVSAGAAPLKIVTGADYAPYADPAEPEGGLATDIVRKALKLAGQDIEIVFAPWKRGYDGTKTGDFAATFPYVPTDERKAEMVYSDPIIDERQVVMSTVAHPVPYTATADLKGKIICSPLGYALPDAVAAVIKSGAGRQESPKDLDSCGKMLLAGRADYIIGDVFVLSALFKRLGAADKVTASKTAVEGDQLFLIAGKTVPDSIKVISAFNEGLKKLKASGEYDRIIRTAGGGL